MQNIDNLKSGGVYFFCMRNSWIVVIAVVMVMAVGMYVGRYRLKTMFMGPSAPTSAPISQNAPTPDNSHVPSDNIYKVLGDEVKGAHLTDFQGMTLYTFDKDKVETSTCYDTCEKNWPYYTSGATAQKILPAHITVIKRTDGHEQFAWKGMPLYYYIKDTKAGDMLGDGVGGIWHIIKP